MEAFHKPVLLDETISYLLTDCSGIYLDLTTGEGGHSRVIAEKLQPQGKLICFDRDIDIQTIARDNLKNFNNITFVLENFSRLKDSLNDLKLGKVKGILADLGLSMFHYKKSEKGFSFILPQPLNMSLDSSTITLNDIISGYNQEEIADILFTYGEESHGRKIADYIVQYRRQKKIETTVELAEIIKKALGHPEKKGFHPATKAFQAFRIYVNREFENLEKMMSESLDILDKGGRLLIITYHSLEDRIVKNFFKEKARENQLEIIVKKPIIASEHEIAANPSARSAKLRIAEKI